MKSKYGDGYVIITGGGSGIGFGFANEFLKQKFKLLLISSNEIKLKEAKKQLLLKHPDSHIEILPYNLNIAFTEDNVLDLDKKISDIIKNEEISILFNNAGVAFRGILERQTKNINSMINVNLIAPVFLCKIILEKMNKRSKRSLIVFSGSAVGQMRYGRGSIYSSTKAFIESYNECLQRGYKNKIDFTCLEIGPVFTDMSPVNYPLTETPESFASKAIKYIGKYTFTPGCFKHFIVRFVYHELPFVKNIFHYFDEKKIYS